MKKRACYNNLAYWDRFLAANRLSAAGFCECDAPGALIVNVNLVASKKCIYSSRWLCLPDCYAAVGFLQYVYLPMLACHLLHGGDELQMPLIDTDTLCGYLLTGSSPGSTELLATLRRLQSLWHLSETECMSGLQEILTDFADWRRGEVLAQILLFTEVPQVCEYIKEQIWCEEVFYEDFGCSYSWLEKLCQSFAHGSFFRYRLLRFLNDRVGCLTA